VNLLSLQRAEFLIHTLRVRLVVVSVVCCEKSVEAGFLANLTVVLLTVSIVSLRADFVKAGGLFCHWDFIRNLKMGKLNAPIIKKRLFSFFSVLTNAKR
jgi:hypothetical protein